MADVGKVAGGLTVPSGGGGGSDYTPPLYSLHAISPTTNPAGISSRNGHPILTFDDTTGESTVLQSALSRDYSTGNLVVDIVWMSEDQTTGDVRWDVSAERMNTDLDADSFATAQSATGTCSGTNGITTTTSITFTQAQFDGATAGDAIRIKVARNPSHGDDDMLNDAQLVRVQVRAA